MKAEKLNGIICPNCNIQVQYQRWTLSPLRKVEFICKCPKCEKEYYIIDENDVFLKSEGVL